MTKQWKFEPETKTIRDVPSNHWVATMDSWDGAENHEANAQLIAAAPALLAACEKLAEWDQSSDDAHLISAACSMARAAIRAAKGEMSHD